MGIFQKYYIQIFVLILFFLFEYMFILIITLFLIIKSSFYIVFIKLYAYKEKSIQA